MKFDSNYPPIRHIDDLESKVNHSIVLYDKEEYGRLVKIRFIENGLKKGENSVYLTHGDVKVIENHLEEYGIDVDLYKRKKLLHIIQIENIMESKEGIEQSFTKLLKEITTDLKPPYRFTAEEPTIPDVSTKEGMEAELIVENTFHSNFDKYQCSFLCAYQINAIELANRPKWINHLMEYHHNLIYATEPEKSVMFETDLVIPLNE